MSTSDFYMLLGFCLAAYSIVANDAIQTLGTFLSSNAHRPWWVLWCYACGVLLVVFFYGWWVNHGDVAYGRLEKFPVPERITILHVIPPLFILGLTRFGVPVSTTFLVLTVFAPAALSSMVAKSLIGYAVAFVVGLVIYRFVTKTTEQRFIATTGAPLSRAWVGLQWASTAFLWSQWLTHDLANIFVYMPRNLTFAMLAFSVALMLVLHAVIFRRRGGEIQAIVTSKTNTQDIRSATLIDFVYGLVLLVFKEWSTIPMSTTWVFLGLLAGREIAISIQSDEKSTRDTVRVILSDGARATAGLAVSVALALGLPRANALLAEFSGDGIADRQPFAASSDEGSDPDRVDRAQGSGKSGDPRGLEVALALEYEPSRATTAR